jgi:hypothetical protein
MSLCEPLEVLPFYRENVFPFAEAVGLVPVTAAEVVNLGESISAKIDTLIDRAAVMVVDATSPFTRRKQICSNLKLPRHTSTLHP